MSLSPPINSPGMDSPRWYPQVIGLVGLICSIFLLFSYYKILGRSCITFRVMRDVPDQRRLNRHPEELSSQSQSTGLDSCLMHSLPITQFKKSKGEEGGGECAVCLGKFEQGEWVKRLPICSHVFHVSCIDTWFQTHSSCPLCRSSVEVHLFLRSLSREDFHRERSEELGGDHLHDTSIVQVMVEPSRA